MTEAGGPATQAGIRYQDRVAALYLGRMIDPRERPRHERPVEVRIEAPQDVDDLIVRFEDGSRRFIQVKASLKAAGSAWKALWPSLRRQLEGDFTIDDRLELVLGEPSTLANQLSEITRRHDGSDVAEWLRRLTDGQRRIVSSIEKLLDNDIRQVWSVVTRLNICVWPSDALDRDFVPLWMPPSTVKDLLLFRTLADIAWDGAAVRECFSGATLGDRLRTEFSIGFLDPQSWGSAQYRDAVAALSVIEVPGTRFCRSTDDGYLWPRCLRYDQDRRPDFDDDLPGWRDVSAGSIVELRDFPSIDLRSVVVVAGPGFGKTTLVHAIARKTALAGLLPAIIAVPTLSESDLPVAAFLSEELNKEWGVQIDWRAAANAGSVVLLIDGLDEVSSDRRTVILERLKVYRATNPGVRWLMTVRDAAALAPLEDALVVELPPIQEEDISLYVDFYRPGESEVAKALLDRMAARPDLARLARIPIFLALLLVMRQETQDLRRSDLLESYLATLFRPAAFKVSQGDTIDTATLRRIAERAAFNALEAEFVDVSVRLLERCAMEIAPEASADDVREALVRRGVLRCAGLVRLRFPFPIVQEYLASAELLASCDDDLVRRLALIVRRPWAQAIQFALERHPNPVRIVDAILGCEDDAFHTGLRLLGRCLANGMSVSATQWQNLGDRFAEIWGSASWRANKLIDGIIVDAFSQPLHPAVRARLGERRLILDGAGAIVARVRDTRLSLEVLGDLLGGNVEYLMNIGDMQREVDLLGTAAFNMYIARCRRDLGSVEDAQAISALIFHMKIGCVEAEVALAAAGDATLPAAVRLAAWSQSGQELDAKTEELIVHAISSDNEHSVASAARALSSPAVDTVAIMRILRATEGARGHTQMVVEYLIGYLERSGRSDVINDLLTVGFFNGEMRNLALLYVVSAGDGYAFDTLLEQLPTMSAEMVCATAVLFGHVRDRTRVANTVAVIATRNWTAAERVSIASSLATGLTYRMAMLGMRMGTLEPMPPHPGRAAPFGLLQEWLAQDDYEPRDRLRLLLDAVRLGVPGAKGDLRRQFDAVMAAQSPGEPVDDWLVTHALEVLHAMGEAPALEDLEIMAQSGTDSLASCVARLIASGGTEREAEALMRLFENVASRALRADILGALDPLAGRLGLRISRSGNRLAAMKI